MSILWSPDLSVHLQEIDEQHKYFIYLLNAFYDAVQKKEFELIPDIVAQVFSYAEYHFKTEERYFKEFNYADGAEHAILHKNLLRELSFFRNRIKEGDAGELFAGDFESFLEKWLVEHINIHDKKYVSLFREHGIS